MSALTVPREAAAVTRDALAAELRTQCLEVAEQLADHLGGSTIALADARNGVRRVAQVLEQLDPPGWTSAYNGDAQEGDA